MLPPDERQIFVLLYVSFAAEKSKSGDIKWNGHFFLQSGHKPLCVAYEPFLQRPRSKDISFALLLSLYFCSFGGMVLQQSLRAAIFQLLFFFRTKTAALVSYNKKQTKILLPLNLSV